MSSDAVEALLTGFEATTPGTPARAVAARAARLGFDVVPPTGKAKYLRLVRGGAGRDVVLYLDGAKLSSNGTAVRQQAMQVPGADVRARDVHFRFNTAFPTEVLAAFVAIADGGRAPLPVSAAPVVTSWPRHAAPTSTTAPTGEPRRPRRRQKALLAAVAAIAVLLGIGVAAGGDTEVAPTASAAPTSAAAPTTDVELQAAAADEAAALAETDEGTPVGRDPGTGLLSDADAASVVSAAGPTTALAALAVLPVQGRAPKTGYDRDLFGAGWVDTDRNGCDTRNDVLARDLTGEAFKAGTRDCVVLSGTLAEPYAGVTLAFQRGQGTSELVQIDHVVSLSNGWQTGAQGWDATRRTQFANDPLNLLAVDGRLNQQKGDGDTATWLPPNRSYRCDYVARQVAVKVTYGLWTTQAEHNAMATVLSSCPEQLLPDGVVAVLPTPTPTPTTTAAPATTAPRTTAAAVVPAPAPAPAPVTTVPPVAVPAPAPAPVGVYFDNCDAARAAGAAPVFRGDPGYRAGLDRDDDGVGCE